MLLNNSLIDKEYKSSRRNMIIGVILLGLAAVLLVFGFLKTVNAKNNAVHLNDVILSEKGNKTGKVAYLDTVGFFQFASYGDDLGYYIAYDDEYMYIMTIKEKDFDYFAELFDHDDTVRIWGYTKAIPDDCVSYAIEGVNETYGGQVVDYSNFEDMLGDVMLEAHRSVNLPAMLFQISGTEMILSIIAFLAGLIMFLQGRSQSSSYEAYADPLTTEATLLADEISGEDTKVYEKLKVILTDSHLISYNGALKIIDYADIFWAYLTKHRTNGISDYDFLNICTKDGIRTVCGTGKTFGKKNRSITGENHDEIMNILQEKNPEVRLGYDRENMDAFSELCTQQKGNR